jgi:hypothetical protein
MFKLKHEQYFKALLAIIGIYAYVDMKLMQLNFLLGALETILLLKNGLDKDVHFPLPNEISEKTGRRLRKHDYQAHGVYLGLAFENNTWWGKSKRSKEPIYSTQEIYLHLMRLFNQVEFPAK